MFALALYPHMWGCSQSDDTTCSVVVGVMRVMPTHPPAGWYVPSPKGGVYNCTIHLYTCTPVQVWLVVTIVIVV